MKVVVRNVSTKTVSLIDRILTPGGEFQFFISDELVKGDVVRYSMNEVIPYEKKLWDELTTFASQGLLSVTVSGAISPETQELEERLDAVEEKLDTVEEGATANPQQDEITVLDVTDDIDGDNTVDKGVVLQAIADLQGKVNEILGALKAAKIIQ